MTAPSNAVLFTAEPASSISITLLSLTGPNDWGARVVDVVIEVVEFLGVSNLKPVSSLGNSWSEEEEKGAPAHQATYWVAL